MKKFYDKHPLVFALVWIGVYVLALSAADGLSAELGTEKLVTAPLAVLMSLFLLLWLQKTALTDFFGLKKAKFDGKAYLCFVPLLLLVLPNVWGGPVMNLPAGETALYIVSMLCVGFLEEVIFRGFLFRAMQRDNVKAAVIVSSLTFGLGHIVNLLNGAAPGPTLLQIVYAAAAGFLFTVIFLRSGCLWPCIAAHSLVNALSAFAPEQSGAAQLISAAFLTLWSLAYALWILRQTKKE